MLFRPLVNPSPEDLSANEFVPFLKVYLSSIINSMHYALGIHTIKTLNVNIEKKIILSFSICIFLNFTI